MTARRSWGRRLDRLSVPWVVGVCAVAGVGAGWLAGQLASWPGLTVFGGLLCVGAWLALSAESVLVPEPVTQTVTHDEDHEDAAPWERELTEERAATIEPALEEAAISDEAATEHSGEARDDATTGFDPLAMVAIPGGEFLMGSGDDDEEARGWEKPARRVRVSPFACMMYPVTRGLWMDIMNTGPLPAWESSGPDDDRPASDISWLDCIAFCNRLSERQGLSPCYLVDHHDQVSWVSSEGYRLPTEAEWEYACRAGTTTRWSHGDQEEGLEAHAWYAKNADGEPRPVGQKEANPWQLHDMHGNVFERCWDRFSGAYPAPGREPDDNPRGPEHGAARVLRGGSFGVSARGLRCAYRDWDGPSNRNRGIGFRCVRGSGRQL